MEDVLDLYQEPYDPSRPVVCMDETSKQLVAETRIPIPAGPGRPHRIDYEYERKGAANIFMFAEPLRGWRWATVSERRTRVDWAQAVGDLLEVHYPSAKLVRLVMDNLNVHSVASLYEAFPPEEARRLIKRLEVRHTPKHGSWLNVAEIELRALSIQCISRRIADIRILSREVKAWEKDRNRRSVEVDWQFKTADARIRLKHLYPEFQP
jgi:DDE superfamily endonuclease